MPQEFTLPYNPGANTPTLFAPTVSALSREALSGGAYVVDWMTVDYVRNHGRRMVPTDSGPVVVELHAAWGFKIVNFEKVRMESPPEYPAPDQSDANAILLHEHVQVATPTLLPNLSSRVYAVRGIFIFGMLVPAGGGDNLSTGLLACERRPTLTASQITRPRSEVVIPATKAVRLF